MKGNFNIVRQIRLQLKTGFLRKEPPEYTFLRRYPPMVRDRAPPFHKVPFKQIPYLNLYEKAVERNPLYDDEKVYGGYWAQEPQALTLAKKQYEFMQQGMDEDEAFHKATEYVSDLESKSYEELKGVLDALKERNMTLPFMTDSNLVEELTAWKEKLAAVNYNDMNMADKGELDFFIQCKVLKWNEVERERRMKDPLFAFYFEKLREQLFPDAKTLESEARKSDYSAMKSSYYAANGLKHPELLCSSGPFYYEDYVRYFNKAKQTPQLNQWTLSDREEFSKWIIDALAFQHVLDRSGTAEVQAYLRELRALFFPMIATPHLAQKCVLPTQDELKTLLYSNDIGYKHTDNKLFVRRYYRLPMLLFPQESFQTHVCSDLEKLITVVKDDKALADEMNRAGLACTPSSKIFKQVKNELHEVARKHPLVDLSKHRSKDNDSVRRKEDDDDSSSSSSSDAATEETEGAEETEEQMLAAATEFDVDGRLLTSPGPLHVSPDEWAKLLKKYAKTPTNTLEKDREAYFTTRHSGKTMHIEDCRSEADLIIYQRQR